MFFRESHCLLAAARYPLSLRLDTSDTLLNLNSGINDDDGVLSSSPGDAPVAARAGIGRAHACDIMPAAVRKSSPAVARLRRPSRARPWRYA
jgi:hypothetical protein